MKQLYLFTICALLVVVGCTAIERSPTPAIEVVVQTATAGPIPTEIVCSDSQGDVTVTVTPINATTVTVEVSGLQPGENVSLHFSTQSENGGRELSDYPNETANKEGVYVMDQNNLTPLNNEATSLWTIKVIHANGVACAEQRLP